MTPKRTEKLERFMSLANQMIGAYYEAVEEFDGLIDTPGTGGEEAVKQFIMDFQQYDRDLTEWRFWVIRWAKEFEELMADQFHEEIEMMDGR